MRLLFFLMIIIAIIWARSREKWRERDRGVRRRKWSIDWARNVKKSRTEIIHAIIVFTNEVLHKKQKRRNLESTIWFWAVKCMWSTRLAFRNCTHLNFSWGKKNNVGISCIISIFCFGPKITDAVAACSDFSIDQFNIQIRPPESQMINEWITLERWGAECFCFASIYGPGWRLRLPAKNTTEYFALSGTNDDDGRKKKINRKQNPLIVQSPNQIRQME